MEWIGTRVISALSITFLSVALWVLPPVQSVTVLLWETHLKTTDQLPSLNPPRTYLNTLLWLPLLVYSPSSTLIWKRQVSSRFLIGVICFHLPQLFIYQCRWEKTKWWSQFRLLRCSLLPSPSWGRYSSFSTWTGVGVWKRVCWACRLVERVLPWRHFLSGSSVVVHCGGDGHPPPDLAPANQTAEREENQWDTKVRINSQTHKIQWKPLFHLTANVSPRDDWAQSSLRPQCRQGWSGRSWPNQPSLHSLCRP